MNETITVRGIVATAPRHFLTETGLDITSLRLASPSRRWDRATGTWVNGGTNWFSVTAFRVLGANVYRSVSKGDRVIVTGRLKIRDWTKGDRSGTSVDIDADSVGHDLLFGCGTWMRTMRPTSEQSAPPGDRGGMRVDERTGVVDDDDADAMVAGRPGAPDAEPDDTALAEQGANEDLDTARDPIETADQPNVLGTHVGGLADGDAWSATAEHGQDGP